MGCKNLSDLYMRNDNKNKNHLTETNFVNSMKILTIRSLFSAKKLFFAIILSGFLPPESRRSGLSVPATLFPDCQPPPFPD